MSAGNCTMGELIADLKTPRLALLRAFEKLDLQQRQIIIDLCRAMAKRAKP